MKKGTSPNKDAETLRKRAETADECRKYTDLYDFAPIGYFALDGKGRIIEANVTGASILGHEKRSLVGQPFHRFIMPGYFSIFQSHLQKTHELRNKQICKLRLVKSDGSSFDALIETIAGTNGEGKIDHYRSSVNDITEIAQAEEALRQAHELLEAVTMGTKVLIATVDKDLRYTFFNEEHRRELKRLTGKDTEIGMSMSDVLADMPEERDKAIALWDRALKGETVIQTLWFGDPSRYCRFYSTRHTPIRDADGAVVGAGEVTTDVTELIQAEEKLKRLNRTLKAISDSSKAMMRATNETEYLHEVCRIVTEDCGHAMVWIGYAENDGGKRVRPMAYAGFEKGYVETLNITWADNERGRGPTGTAIRTGKPSACKNMLTDPLFKPWREEAIKRGYASSIVVPLMVGGKAFGAINIYSREPDPFPEDEVKLLTELADDLAYGITMIRFRTVYEKSRIAIRESEVRYRSLFSAMTDGFALHEIICTEEGKPCGYRFLDINPAFERLTGLKREEVIGRTIGEVLPDDDTYWIEIYGKVALTGESVHFENYSSDLDRHYEVFAYCPAPRQFATIFTDITKRKQTERILEERTAQLEEANKELESFSYSVSHDLRAPLRAIDGYARMILKSQGKNFDEETLRKFNVIRNNAQIMGQLIDELLSFSHLGKKALSLSGLDMNFLVREVWEELEVANAGRDMSLTLHSIHPGYGDRALIRQVYSNLLSNAVRFTKNRSPALIEVGSYVDGDDKVYYVRDNGVGFDMAYHDKLFGVFQRLHGSEEFEGTGVGLAIVQRIIHRHGGRVWAEGKPDEGACFYFTLSGKE